jgi:hypothetical protein
MILKKPPTRAVFSLLTLYTISDMIIDRWAVHDDCRLQRKGIMCKNRRLNRFDHFQNQHPVMMSIAGICLLTGLLTVCWGLSELPTVEVSTKTKQIVSIKDKYGKVVTNDQQAKKIINGRYDQVWVP